MTGVSDQSRPVSRADARLAAIRALCDRYHAEHWGWDEIRAILDAPSPGAVVSPDANVEVRYDVLAPPYAMPSPGAARNHGIDRGALLAVVRANVNRLQDGLVVTDAEFVDRILAAVRPAEGEAQ